MDNIRLDNYSFNNNYFPYSLPNMFKSLDYSVNAFHMNKKEYFSKEFIKTSKIS